MEEGNVKLTVEIPRELWKRAKQRALDADMDLREVVMSALTVYLEATPAKSLFRPTYRGAKKGGKS